MFMAAARDMRVFGVLLVLVVALGASIGVALSLTNAFATHQDPNEHHACYSLYTGQLRYVTDPAGCASHERAISWNQQGPQGPAGPGASFYINDTVTFVEGEFVVGTFCNDNNDVVIAGGYQITTEPDNVLIQQSFPVESLFGIDQWGLRGVESNPASSEGILSHVICQDIPGL